MSGTIIVVRSGLLTTVQDAGRWGLQDLGVPPAGPMDPLSFRIANRLAGNADGEAGLEITLLGPELRFEADAIIAIAGADLSAAIVTGGSTEAIAPPAVVTVRHGGLLRFGERRRLARAYLAVRGGLDVPAVLGSCATSLQAGLPGLAGRPLRAGDALPIGTRTAGAVGRASATTAVTHRDTAVVRFIWGPDDDRLADTALRAFTDTVYRLAPSSNRMGYRLEGTPLAVTGAGRMLSEATPVGSIQVPPSGHPILLMADRQTTGGYPRIGTVVTADLPIAGQLVPGDAVRFEPCSPAEALVALRAQDAFAQSVSSRE